MRRRAILLVTLSSTLLSISLTAAEPPNFSGRWVLNAGRSEYGSIPAPASLVRTIAQSGVNLVIDSVQKGAAGEVASHYVYTTDGKLSINKLKEGQSAGNAHFEGSVLIVESAREYKDATLRQTEKWRMVDANTLQIDALIDVPTGKFDVRQVFERVGERK